MVETEVQSLDPPELCERVSHVARPFWVTRRLSRACKPIVQAVRGDERLAGVANRRNVAWDDLLRYTRASRAADHR